MEPFFEGHLPNSLEHEAQSRAERLEFLNSQVRELFPEEEFPALGEEIAASYDVPQYGEYHTEGRLMDSHLIRILKNIADVQAGRFDPRVPEEIRAQLQAVVQEQAADFSRYAFLHDLAKKDCLTLKKGGQSEEISWADYQARYPEEIRRDPRALDQAFKKDELTGVSYFQPQAKRQHGEEAAKGLKAKYQGQLPDILILAIAKHEVAF